MTIEYSSAFWSSVAPAIADHLWQSTLVACAASLLTLVLRNDSARLRYSVWFAASLKFLIPFSLLVAAGSQFSWRHIAVKSTAGMYVVEIVSQPFTKPLPITRAAVVAPPSSGSALHVLGSVLTGVWLCGFVTVLCVWIARWWRVSAAIRRSVLLDEGRELSALHHLEDLAGMTSHMQILLSQTSLEPGVFGILRPVLLWPHSISEHLDDGHLEAVLAHELCHVRRRDNLAAALHMLIEAIFWFHPLVWWMGARLIEERERACDEGVLEFGSRRHVYAESILRVCEFCLSSPLTCVSGVTGADLKKRMVYIMTDRVIPKLNFTRKVLLWTAACLAIALPIAFGLFSATPSRAEAQLGTTPKFATVSVQTHSGENNGFTMTRVMTADKKDQGFAAKNVSPHMLLQLAYHIQDTQVVGEPDWFTSAKYDIDAKLDQSTADAISKLNPDERNLINQRLLQQFLADYFKVTVHQDSRDLPVYELLIADGGPKLQKVNTFSFMHMGIGEISSQGTPLDLLTAQLSQRLGRTVVDKTGLSGTYAFSLHWTPDTEEQVHMRAAGLPDLPPKGAGPGQPVPVGSGPPLMTALQEELGLKLQPQTERVQVLVIDHAEQPAQN